jgi:hypothetical protein
MTLAVVSYLGGTVEEVADLTDRRGPHGPRDREAVVAHARLEDSPASPSRPAYYLWRTRLPEAHRT